MAQQLAMENCIRVCLDCYKTCQHMALTHCLKLGGEHVEPEHFRLMVNCADICRTAADFMLSESPWHARVCAVCSEICKACAESCKKVGDMDDCVSACEQCAQECYAMSVQ